MRKKSLLAMLLAMTLLLSSCALIVKDQAVDDATVILQMGDRTYTKAEVKNAINNQLQYSSYTYSMYGMQYDPTDPENIAEAQASAIKTLKQQMVLEAKGKEFGLDQLTDEEKEAVQTEAQEDYDYALNYAKTTLLADSGLEGDALEAAALEELKNREISLESYVTSATESKVNSKVREYIIKDVAVSDEEIQAEYDSRVESAKETYAENPGSYATAVNNGTTVYYAPAGVRRVKQILTKFKDEDQTVIDEANTAVTDANTAITTAQAKVDSAQETLDAMNAEGVEGVTEEDKANAQADLDAANKELNEANAALEAANKALQEATDKAFANLDEEVDAILAQLDEGADWQTLMDEKNQDPGMKSNEKGYAVSADMTSFDPAFVEAAMALEKIGDHSGKVKGTSYGYYIIRYESDEPEGAIALEDVKETISSSLLTTKQNDTYNTTLEQWVEAAGIKEDLNALKD